MRAPFPGSLAQLELGVEKSPEVDDAEEHRGQKRQHERHLDRGSTEVPAPLVVVNTPPAAPRD